jgi:hypothetical protein
LVAGCDRDSTSTIPQTIVDPPEAIPPSAIVGVHKTNDWGEFRIEVESASAYEGDRPGDVDISVDMTYTNLGVKPMPPPHDVRLESGGNKYAAAATNTRSIAPGVSEERWVRGTLTGAAHADPPSRDDLQSVLVKTQLVFGTAGTAQVIFPFTQG